MPTRPQPSDGNCARQATIARTGIAGPPGSRIPEPGQPRRASLNAAPLTMIIATSAPMFEYATTVIDVGERDENHGDAGNQSIGSRSAVASASSADETAAMTR